MRPPPCDHLCDRALGGKVPFLCIGPDQKSELDVWKGMQHVGTPCFGADRWRGKVRTLCVIARKTKSHGQNGNACCIIKDLFVYSHPITQPIPRRIRKRPPALMDPGTRCLPCYQNFCGCFPLKHRARHVPRDSRRKSVFAQVTGRKARENIGRDAGRFTITSYQLVFANWQ